MFDNELMIDKGLRFDQWLMFDKVLMAIKERSVQHVCTVLPRLYAHGLICEFMRFLRVFIFKLIHI